MTRHLPGKRPALRPRLRPVFRPVLAVTALAGVLTLSACVGAGGPGAGSGDPAGAPGVDATTAAPTTGETPPAGATGTAGPAAVAPDEDAADPAEELFTKLLVSEDFPFESDQTGDGVSLEPHAPMSVPEFTGTTLVECTDHTKAVIESGGFSAGARITGSTNVPEDGALDVPSHVVELGVLDTAGLPDPTKARSQWSAFAEAATGCGEVELRDLPGTAALESTELPQETFAFTKDLAPEDHGGVGVTCFAALQEEPNALDSVPEPGQRTTCVAADDRYLVWSEGRTSRFDGTVPSEDELSAGQDHTWDTLVLQAERLGLALGASPGD